jgi:hypothetical protein
MNLDDGHDVAQKVQQMAAMTVREVDACVICGSPEMAMLGMWFPGPEDAAALGVPQGLTRVYHYKLCGPCAAESPKESVKKVEAALRRDLGLPPAPGTY